MTNEPNRPKASLFDNRGARKYLTRAERDAFLAAAATLDRETQTFCMTLALTGMRLSEALSLSGASVDLASKAIVVETLKKRREGVYRSIPASPELLDALRLVHGLGGARRRTRAGNDLLWPWSRRTGARRVEEVMQLAGIEGPHATAKGLRHCFGVTAIQAGIALNKVQQWLGHSALEVTAIYADAQGEEEHQLAARMW
jgi:integrase/recombinase XerD